MCNYSIYMVVQYWLLHLNNCIIYCHGVWVIPEVLIVCSVFFLMVNDPLGLKPNDVRKIPLPKFSLFRKNWASFITDIVPQRRSYYHPVSKSVSKSVSQSISQSVSQSVIQQFYFMKSNPNRSDLNNNIFMYSNNHVTGKACEFFFKTKRFLTDLL